MARARKTTPKKDRSTDGRERSATPRGIWSGSISFGLLQIPVSLHTAERRGGEIHLRLLDRRAMTPIRTQRINPDSGKPVDWEDIVKGYEYEPGQFVVLDDDDLKKANVAATQTIDIQDFVPARDIDPAHFEKPYFAVPTKRSAKAYVLLREALKRKDAAAIATFVLRTRQHLCALLAVGDAILVEVLRFGHELVSAEDLPLPAADDASSRYNERELSMAERLIEEMMTDWQPQRYKDEFYNDVMKMIDQKVRTGRIRTAHPKAKGEVASNVVDLVSVLQKSVQARGKGGKGGRRESRRKQAA